MPEESLLWPGSLESKDSSARAEVGKERRSFWALAERTDSGLGWSRLRGSRWMRVGVLRGLLCGAVALGEEGLVVRPRVLRCRGLFWLGGRRVGGGTWLG